MAKNDLYDAVVIGAGLYGLYSALFLGKQGMKVLVLEADERPFMRATYINQARVHMGYHYPRSLSTAEKSAHYFERFVKEYSFCINREFKKVYAISGQFSMTNGEQFVRFCKTANIPCEEVNPNKFFRKGTCEGAYLTCEYTYDAHILCRDLLDKIEKNNNITVQYSSAVTGLVKLDKTYEVMVDDKVYETPVLINTTYASVNQILNMAKERLYKIKYELCEIILVKAGEMLDDYGITVMDGPFFSVMPFGKTGLHSLTSVTFTPHATSYDLLPSFPCQQVEGCLCKDMYLGNCNECPAKPHTAFDYMNQLAKKYLRDEYSFTYEKSLFSMKPILKASELDDSRPTVIDTISKEPTFISVLSGKINTVYDLDEVLPVR